MSSGIVDLSAYKKPAANTQVPTGGVATSPGAGLGADTGVASGPEVVAGGPQATGGVPQATAGEPRVPGPYRIDITESNLEQVLQTSMHLPVIIVFSSEHSANSAKLVALFERLTRDYGGRFQLGTVDVEAQRQVTAAFGVNAVPTAAAILATQPTPLFQGLPEEEAVRQVIDQVLAAGEQSGISGVLDGDPEGVIPEPEIPPLHKEGLEALERGDLDGAHAAYTQALKENVGDNEARLALYQVELLQRLSTLNPEGTAVGAEEILKNAASAELTEVDVHLQAADLEVSFGRADAAFSRLIDVIKATTGDERDRVRTRLLQLFEIVGPHTELVTTARRALTNALF
ncbi:MAG: tetratricopeptide repeat protein [Actinomycetaceae bacterium]|nr:tetratricopeptide repeat protein [Actinomycetaceae bacterium]